LAGACSVGCDPDGSHVEGTVLLEQQGKPPATLKAGDTFLIPSGTPHNATNKGTVRARVLELHRRKGQATGDAGEVIAILDFTIYEW
jgi:mannose-6-phosphate isomerase-like protein (cupin superfamily)